MPTDRGKQRWRTAATSLSARRVQTGGVDNNKVLAPSTVSGRESLISAVSITAMWRPRSDLFVPAKNLISQAPQLFSKINAILRAEGKAWRR